MGCSVFVHVPELVEHGQRVVADRRLELRRGLNIEVAVWLDSLKRPEEFSVAQPLVPLPGHESVPRAHHREGEPLTIGLRAGAAGAPMLIGAVAEDSIHASVECRPQIMNDVADDRAQPVRRFLWRDKIRAQGAAAHIEPPIDPRPHASGVLVDREPKRLDVFARPLDLGLPGCSHTGDLRGNCRPSGDSCGGPIGGSSHLA